MNSLNKCSLQIKNKTSRIISSFTYIKSRSYIHKRLSVGLGINSNVGYVVLSFYPSMILQVSFYPKHDPVAGGGKSVDFVFPD